MNSFRKYFLFLSTILLTLYLGCSSPTSSVKGEGQISIVIKSITNTCIYPLNKPVASVTITSARIVIEEIEFESSVEGRFDFELEEPFVQDLAVDTSSHEIATVQVPFGVYEEMEIEIDKLDATDAPTFVQNPQLQNLSIRVEGFLDGDAANTFVFTSDLSEEQEREFNPPLVIDETTPSTSVVLTLDMGMWFVDNNNNTIDPRLESNRSLIESNIKASLGVFEDDDDDEDDSDDDE